MMDRGTLQELLNREPFESFRIYMSDGHAYEATDPNMMVAMDTKLFIALPGDRWKMLSYGQITRIEDIGVSAG